MQRILIPTDFSRNAWNAIDYAMKLFQGNACAFYLLNTYTPYIPSGRLMAKTEQDFRFQDSVRLASEKGLKTTLGMIKGANPDPLHQFEVISSFKLLVEEVREQVEALGIDLVVTGTKGATGRSGVFMGSNTVRMIKSARNCPILAIPHHFGFVAPTQIALATDFGRFHTGSELRPLLAMAEMFRASIQVIQVQNRPGGLTELQQFNRNNLQKQLQGFPHKFHSVPILDSVSGTLEEFSRENEIQLLALLHHQHSYMERMTREPVIQRAAFHTKVPLLVLPELGMEGPYLSQGWDRQVLDSQN